MLPYILAAAIAIWAFKQPASPPAPQAPVRPPLDQHLPAEAFKAVWNCYDRCSDAGQLRAFASELSKAGFNVAANLLSAKANQIAPMPAPQPQKQAVSLEAIKKAIENLSPEQKAIFDSMVNPQKKEEPKPAVQNGKSTQALPEVTVSTLSGTETSQQKVAVEVKS